MSIQFIKNNSGTISVQCGDEDDCNAVQQIIDSMNLIFSHAVGSNFFSITYSSIQKTINKNYDSSSDDDEQSLQQNVANLRSIINALISIGGNPVDHFQSDEPENRMI
jgi:hypothetical protein